MKMKVFSVHYKQANKGGPRGFVVAENEDNALEKIRNHFHGEIKRWGVQEKDSLGKTTYAKEELPERYVFIENSGMSYFVREEDGWVIL